MVFMARKKLSNEFRGFESRQHKRNQDPIITLRRGNVGSKKRSRMRSKMSNHNRMSKRSVKSQKRFWLAGKGLLSGFDFIK